MSDYKIEVFINRDWKTSDKVFKHYWYNDGQNYFDSVNQTWLDNWHHKEEETIDFVSEFDGYKGPTEAYLEQFKKVGYKWEEIIPTKRQFSNCLDRFSIQIDDATFDVLPTMFFRVTGYANSDFPLYYYSDSITGVSDDNILRRSYEVNCSLDMWATFWVYMHHFMKDCEIYADFLQKMCDRFVFNYQEGIDTNGFIIDYIKQPYLMRSGKYETRLYANDTRENFLTLEEFLFINSGKKDVKTPADWIVDTWLNWLKSPWVGTFSPLTIDSRGSGDKVTFNTEDIGKYQNKLSYKLSSFYDTEFNSNTKYRYLVCKVGNNTLPKLKETDYVSGMFTQFKQSNLFASSTDKHNGTLLGDEANAWIETKPWVSEEEPGSYEYYKEVEISNINLKESGSVCIAWENFFMFPNYLNMVIDSSILSSYTITWFDDFQLKQHRTILNAVVLNKEYEVIKLPTKSYAYDIDGSSINVSLVVNIKFTEYNKAYLVFRLKFDINYEKFIFPKLTVYPDQSYEIKDLIVTNDTSKLQSNADETVINGETLMIVPFKKGVEEQDYLKWLNSTNAGINMGDGSVLGMPINDIPPAVLGLAIRRQNDESDYQTIGDALSIRHADGVNCPLSLVDFYLKEKEGSKSIDIPVFFSSFDYIPVVIASAPLKDDIYQCIGGNNFFNYYYDLLTRSYLTGNTWLKDSEGNWVFHGGNNIESEPFLYGPQFWKWAYYIDGGHSIELSGELLDFTKLLTNRDWEVKLNVNFNSVTGYFLDISDIKNNRYPMSKLGVEFITGDPASFPHTTEAYNNWVQGNQLTQETAKNAKDITNKFVKKRGILDATVGALEVGASTTASGMGSLLTAGAAAGFGAAAAAAHAAGAITGMEFTMQENTQQFENKWRGELQNMYNAPSQLNPSGFASGSLIYSPVTKANQNSYELFRTYSAPDNIKQKVWYDISMNGYPFLSQCQYKDYNNRLNFNVVNCNLNDRQYFFFNYLREKMFKISPIFAQTNFVLSFFKKCQDLFRVFKCEYDENNMDEIISGNIELKREWVEPYFAPARTAIFEVNKHYIDNQAGSWTWNDNYEWDSTGKILKRKNLPEYTMSLSYVNDLGVSDYEGFLDKYSNVALGAKGSNALLKVNNATVKDSVSINSNDFGPGGLILPEQVNKYIDIIATNNYLNKAIYVKIGGSRVEPVKYELGWNVAIADDTDKLKITLNPKSQWTFNSDVHTGTIHNKEFNEERKDATIYLQDYKSERKFENDSSIKNVICVYKDGNWKNGFKPTKTGDMIYYDPYNRKPFEPNPGYKGCVHPMTEITLGKDTTMSYASINPAIKTREDFFDYYSKFEFDINSLIQYTYKWPEEIEKARSLDGSGKLSIQLVNGTYEYSGYKNLGGIGSGNEEAIPEYWKGDYFNRDISDATQSAVAGKAQDSEYSPVHYANADVGLFATRINYKVTFNESNLVVHVEDASFAACWGRRKDECYPRIKPFNEYGYDVWRAINRKPDKSFFGLGRDNNFKNLSSNIQVNSVKFYKKDKEYPSTWHMNNQLNNIVFIAKEDRLLTDGIITKNKRG